MCIAEGITDGSQAVDDRYSPLKCLSNGGVAMLLRRQAEHASRLLEEGGRVSESLYATPRSWQMCLHTLSIAARLAVIAPAGLVYASAPRRCQCLLHVHPVGAPLKLIN